MFLAYPTHLEERGGLEGGYGQYRQARASMLETYCIGVLFKNRQLNTAVGIALDAHWSQTGRRGGSEDLMAIASRALAESPRKDVQAYSLASSVGDADDGLDLEVDSSRSARPRITKSAGRSIISFFNSMVALTPSQSNMA